MPIAQPKYKLKLQVFWYVTYYPLVYRFLCDEGSRSRRYGRTATLRLIVQTGGEDD
jgi:hypothetical protein